MRQRLTLALVGVALASVVLVGAGVLILAQVGAGKQATNEAIEQMDVLTEIASNELNSASAGARRRRPGAPSTLQRVIPALGFEDARIVIIPPSGDAATVDGFAFPVATSDSRAGGNASPDEGTVQRPVTPRTLTPLTELDDDQLATLMDGDSILLDGNDLTEGSSFGDSDRTVIVLQALPSSLDGDGARMIAVVGRHPVVTVAPNARLWFVISALAVLLGAVIASILLARRFSTPITDIERATAAVAAGDFTTRVEVDGDDELAHLGRSVNEMAAVLERSKALDQQFLMSVSHDLRTPLTAISGYGEALRDGAIDDPRSAGEVIGNQAARLERLVGDLLDLARLDANRFRLDLHDVDVAVVVGRTLAGLQPRAESHGLACRFENGGPAVATVDPDRLGQAVGNLIDNAIKHATSMIVAEVRVGVDDVAIAVTDDGPGIADEDLPHVFERLYVSRHQPVRAENPSGMGLAIVRELTIAMGGMVEATRGSAGGTSMTIRLPMARAVRSE